MHPAWKFLRLLSAWLFLLGAWVGARAAIPIQHWQQPSGAQVYLVESRSIPMVDIQIDFDGGGRRDPRDQAGLASVTAAMTGKGVLAHGDRPALDENQLSQAWADLGAGFGGDAGSDRMSFSLRSLTDPALLDRAIELAARQFGEPAFPPPVWERDRQRMSAAIREANTRPGTVAAKAFDRAVYDTHPYGAEVTEATLAAIAVEDMQRFFRVHVLPCRAKVSVVGDLDRAQVDAIVARVLARLPQAEGACPALPQVPEVAPLAASRTVAIPFASAQAHVLIGEPGYKRSDPDHLRAAGRQLHPRRRRAGVALVHRGARKARPVLRRLQLFLPRAARRRLHDRPADAARPGGAGHRSGPRGACPVRRRRADAGRAEGGQGLPGRRLSAAHRQQPQAAGQRGRRWPGTDCRWTTWTPGPPRWRASRRRTCGRRCSASWTPGGW